MDFLIVVDMQHDFIDGVLGTKEAVSIVDNVIEKIKGFEGKVIATRDTHQSDYLDTQEGRNLPVSHCIEGSKGWEIHEKIAPYTTEAIDKPVFGSMELSAVISSYDKSPKSITLIGVCTDICVISNAIILKSAFPETKIIVDSACCAGVTKEAHEIALMAMKPCQIEVI